MDTYQAIIFDMDGVMVDTEPLHFKATNIVAEKYGCHLTPEMMQKFTGIPRSNKWAEVIEEFNLPVTVKELRSQKGKIYRKLLSENIIPMAGLDDLLFNLKKDNYKMAIASSSSIEEINMIVDELKVRDYFEVILSGHRIENPKPKPDIYLMTAEKLGVSPEKCLVLEDTFNGLKSAKAAGMTCLVVPNDFTRNQDFSMADKILGSLEEVYKFLK